MHHSAPIHNTETMSLLQ